jgi:hypothetical protein
LEVAEMISDHRLDVFPFPSKKLQTVDEKTFDCDNQTSVSPLKSEIRGLQIFGSAHYDSDNHKTFGKADSVEMGFRT